MTSAPTQGDGARRSIASLVRAARPLRRGFTMVEVLVALVLVALVMVAMNTFIFSMGELWGRGSDLRLFELHTRNVSRFIERELRVAALPPAGSGATAPIIVKEVRQQNGATEPLLTFELPEGSRLLAWTERALPDVVCSLACREREGLFLLWQSRHETRFGDDAPRETQITPFVSEVGYEYYDADFKVWKTERTMKRDSAGNYVTPGRLRLTFLYSGRTITSVITVPAAVAEGVPAP